MRVSHETIYLSLYVQARGALRRELAQNLRTGRMTRRPTGHLPTVAAADTQRARRPSAAASSAGLAGQPRRPDSEAARHWRPPPERSWTAPGRAAARSTATTHRRLG